MREKQIKDLIDMVDDSTTHIEVPTPEGWKCDRKGCPTDFYHEHTTFGTIPTHPKNKE